MKQFINAKLTIIITPMTMIAPALKTQACLSNTTTFYC